MGLNSLVFDRIGAEGSFVNNVWALSLCVFWVHKNSFH
jgi:hypothetical protein